MNSFYNLNIVLQWITAILMLVAAGLCSFLWFDLMEVHIAAIFFLFILTPIMQFLVSPIMTLSGVYKYVSPMLLVYAPNKKKYDLHNGTSFDYLLVFWGIRMGTPWQNRVLLFYLEGLLAIIDQIENQEIPEIIEIRGSSYFFSPRTAEKLGFEIKETGIFEKLNVLINYIDLTWMYSASKNSICFPSLSNIKTATTSGTKLKEKKQDILTLHNYLSRRLV
jgi:hypothetical protein